MVVAYLLFQKIITFFLIMLCGYFVVRLGLVKAEDSQILSKLLLYLIMPCAILNSFQVDFSKEVQMGLIFAFAVAILFHIIMITANMLYRGPLGLSPIEQANIIYPTCGNLTMPLVAAVLGPEWVIYTSAYISVQILLLWTHAKSLISQSKGFDIKKALANVNMIAIGIGLVLFTLHLKLPGPLGDSVATLGNFMGPLSMLITGMMLSKSRLPDIVKNKRIWLITAMRLIIVPLVLLSILRFSILADLVPDGSNILLCTLLGVITPPAAAIASIELLHGGGSKSAEYASQLSVICTLLCVITMPVMVLLYML